MTDAPQPGAESRESREPTPAAPPSSGPPAPGAPTPPPDPTDVEREVAEAMAGMSAEDLEALTGGIGVSDAGTNVVATEPGSEMTGTVVGLSGEDVFLQFGDKANGVLPRSQFGKNEVVEAGRRVDIVVDRYDSENDLLICSRQGAIQRATWTNLNVGMIVEGRVTGMNKGGLEVDLRGIRAFLPASHADIGHLKDVSVLIGERVQCEVLEVDRRAKNVLVSRRKILEKQRAETAAKLREELEEGQVRTGVVGNLTDFGAFVDLGGVDGLIHISDLSWTQVKRVSDVVSPGQTVNVKVLKIDPERDRISLGLKQATPDPWTDVESRFPVGANVRVRVVRIADFGAFAELEPGVDGLIPISEMSWGRVNRPADVVSVGALVDVVVIRVEPDRRRIALSMKQATPDPWAEVLDSFEKGALTRGRITRLADFGAFVEIVPGVEGMIHISQLSSQHVRACSDVVEVGQDVEVRVLDVDPAKRRISLSIKAVAEAAPAPDGAPEAPPKPKKTRKKPLRGGLSSDWDW